VSMSMYDASIPVFIHVLANLTAILDKGQAHARARGIDPAVLVGARLAPDMFPLSRQVQIATDVVKGFAARMTGAEPPNWPDTEATFDELIARVGKAVDYLGSVEPSRLEGTSDRTVSFAIRGEPVSFQGLAYLQKFVLPNLYFHTAITYAILRHNGVELGKRDFLGQV
jgi:hypothetical protein